MVGSITFSGKEAKELFGVDDVFISSSKGRGWEVRIPRHKRKLYLPIPKHTIMEGFKKGYRYGMSRQEISDLYHLIIIEAAKQEIDIYKNGRPNSNKTK